MRITVAVLLCVLVCVARVEAQVCDPGSCSNQGQCFSCLSGTVAGGTGTTCFNGVSGKCAACPVNNYCPRQANNGGAITTTSCSTPTNFDINGNGLSIVCPVGTACPGGHYCGPNFNQAPVACVAGRPCDVNEQVQFGFCDDLNQVVVPFSAGGMPIQCQDCPAITAAGLTTDKGVYGTGQIGSRGLTCATGTVCFVNQCRFQTNPPSVATCTNCKPGTGSNVGTAAATFAANSDYFCGGAAAGQQLFSIATCSDCPVGQFAASYGGNCIVCPANTYQENTASQTCINCPAGTAFPGTEGSASIVCEACLAGTAAVSGGACEPCAANSYSDSGSASACTLCPAGKHVVATGSDSSAACTNCPANTASVSGGPCLACPTGSSSVPGSGSCATCLDDYWLPPQSPGQCVPCWTAATRNATAGEPACTCPTGTEQLEVTVAAVSGAHPPGFVNGNDTSTRFATPSGVTDSQLTPNLFVSDRDNHVIREVSRAGVSTTFTGSGQAGYLDGNSTSAQFNLPVGIASEPTGDLIVADSLNHRLRRVAPSGDVTTFLGSGSANIVFGTGTGANIGQPEDVVINPDTNTVYFVSANAAFLFQATNPGAVFTSLIGDGTTGNVQGSGTNAKIQKINWLAMLNAANNRDLILATVDGPGTGIRRVPLDGSPTTAVGIFITGQAQSITVEPTSQDILYGGFVGATGGIFRLTLAGVMTAFAGNGDTTSPFAPGDGLLANFPFPIHIAAASYPQGDILMTSFNRILRIGRGCIDINECANATLNTCPNDAAVVCTNTAPGFKCECAGGAGGTGTTCTTCAPGTFKAFAGDGACVSCTVGSRPAVEPTWTDLSGQTACKTCPEPSVTGTLPLDAANAVSVDAGATTCNYCGNPTIGCGTTFASCLSNVGVGATCSCSGGRHLVGGGLPGGALQCEPGAADNSCSLLTFPSFGCSNVGGAPGCGACDTAGTGVVTYGDPCCNDSPLTCCACPVGTQSLNNRPGAGNPLSYECVPCPLHTYQDATGQTTCTPCPVGETTLAPGANSSALCLAAATTTAVPVTTTAAPVATTTAVPVTTTAAPVATTTAIPATTTAAPVATTTAIPATTTAAPVATTTAIPATTTAAPVAPTTTVAPLVFHIWHEAQITLEAAIALDENGVWIPTAVGANGTLVNGTLIAQGGAGRTGSQLYTFVGAEANMVPDGVTFGNQNVTLVLKYNAVTAAANTNPLVCVTYNTVLGEWEVVPGSARADNGGVTIVTCETTHFTLFAAAQANAEESTEGDSTPVSRAISVGIPLGVVALIAFGVAVWYGKSTVARANAEYTPVPGREGSGSASGLQFAVSQMLRPVHT
jgi:hypothetical protein